jgi:hypothetical protein
MSKIDDRLAERRRQATEAAQAATQPTAPVPADSASREEKPAEKPAAKPATARSARPARTPKAAEEPAEMSKEERARWRWLLGATAGKGRAALDRADEAVRAWERLIAQARIEGVPERLLMAAALEADMDLPAAE